MNLRNIANSVITGINPNIKAKLIVNDGYEIDDYGNQIPKTEELEITIQTQSLSTQDLQHLNLVSQQGSFLYAYTDHFLFALRRPLQLGQDKLVFKPYGESDETEWLIKQVVESYSNWNKVLVWRQ